MASGNYNGKLFIKKDSVWKRGSVWHKHYDAALPVTRIFVKIDGEWRDTI